MYVYTSLCPLQTSGYDSEQLSQLTTASLDVIPTDTDVISTDPDPNATDAGGDLSTDSVNTSSAKVSPEVHSTRVVEDWETVQRKQRKTSKPEGKVFTSHCSFAFTLSIEL